jgi:uncharacterized BrkB/YihY/UPF0761 family membrane protein
VVWFSRGVIKALRIASALAWNLPFERARRPLAAIAVFNAVFVAAGIGPVVLAWLRDALGSGALASVILILALQGGLAWLILALLPNDAPRAGDHLPGALLIAVGVNAVQVAVVVYFAPKLGRASETYGAFGAAATILVWLYVGARLLTSALYLNATLVARRGR